MKSLFSFVKPQIAFGAGGRGGGSSRGSGIKPTGFADQASRMANSQRQLGAPQFPGFNLEAEKDVPSVARRNSSRDNSPIDAGSGGFLGGFQTSPKAGSGGGSSYGSDPNPFRSAFGSGGGSGTSSTETGRLDLSGIGGVADVKSPSFESQGTSRPVGLPRAPVRSITREAVGLAPRPTEQSVPNVTRTAPTMKKPPMPRVIADDFIPRNPDGSPKYTTPDGRPLRRPYDPSTPSRPTPTPGGGKGGGGIARPPRRPRPTPPTPGPDMPTPRPIVEPPVMRPGPTIPGGGKGGAGPIVPRRDPVMVDPRNPTGAPDPVDPIQQVAIGRQQQFPTGPRRYAPGTAGGQYQAINEFGVPRQGGRPSVPRNDPAPRRSTPAPTPMPMPYGGKGGGSMPNRTTRRPQMPFTYYRPRR